MRKTLPVCRCLILLCAYLATYSAAPPGFAGPGQSPGPGAKPPPKRNGLLQSQILSKEPELPHFPKYTGKYLRYRGGMVSNGLTPGESFNLRYETAEKPDQVVDWYAAALKQYGYDISQKKPTGVTAMQPQFGIGVVISIQNAAQPGFSPYSKTHFNIRFIQQPTK